MPASGSTVASRALRQAALAVARAFRAHRSCERYRLRAPALVLKKLGLHVHHRLLAGCCQPPCQVSTEAARAFSTAQSDAWGTVWPSVLKGPQARARLCRKVAHSMSSPSSSTAARATDALWGSTPISTFMRAHLRVGRISLALACVKDTPTLGCALSHIPLLSHSEHAAVASGTQAQNKPTLLCTSGRQELRERSLLWRPRSLAAADH